MENNIKEPKITTMSIDVKVIRIGNKQMTKAVFNQLYTERLWDDDFNVLFPIWGKVHDGDLEYAIFQKEDSLKKARIDFVSKTLNNGRRTMPSMDFSRYKNCSSLFNFISERLEGIQEYYEGYLNNLKSDVPFKFRFRSPIYKPMELEFIKPIEIDETSTAKLVAYLKDLDFNGLFGFLETHDVLNVIVVDWTTYRKRRMAIFKMIKEFQDLPQLYIAV